MNPAARARLIGLIALVAVFLAGIAAGMAISKSRARGIQVIMTATDAVPKELERLGLSQSQREQVKAILRTGRGRVLKVIDDFDPRFRAAADSTDLEIRSVLTDDQKTKFDAYRIAHPQFLPRKKILGRNE